MLLIRKRSREKQKRKRRLRCESVQCDREIRLGRGVKEECLKSEMNQASTMCIGVICQRRDKEWLPVRL